MMIKLPPPLKNYRHELFALAIVKGLNHTEAAIYAGYKVTRAMQTGGELVSYSDIKERIRQLNEATESPAVMDVIERKVKLTEIARPVLTDFVSTTEGDSNIEIGKDSKGQAAIQEVTTTRLVGKGNISPAIITKLKLHDPIRAIAELNKMGGDYPPSKVEVMGKGGGPVVLKVVYDDAGKKPKG